VIGYFESTLPPDLLTDNTFMDNTGIAAIALGTILETVIDRRGRRCWSGVYSI